MQLTHCGRVSHASLIINGAHLQAPSAIKAAGQTYIAAGRLVAVIKYRALQQHHADGGDLQVTAKARRADVEYADLQLQRGQLVRRLTPIQEQHADDRLSFIGV